MSDPGVPENPERVEGAAPVPLTRREARAAEAAAAAREGVVPAAGAPAASVAPAAIVTPPASAPAAARVVAPARPATTPRSSARPAASSTPSLSRRALGFATFSIVGGLVATTAIPAYGARGTTAASGGAGTAANRAGLQNLTVSSETAGQTAVRDAFAAPTQAQLDEASRQAAVLSGSNGGEFTTVQTRAVGDDYPWPYETIDDDGGGLSPLGYYYRECVDFVAWRLNRDAGATAAPWTYTWGNITPMGGSAWEWPDNWAAKGWATSSVPIVGCVAWWTYNHVSYVQKVNDDGTVLLEEYNYGGKHSYVTRTYPTAQVPLFLYPPAL
ncbi:CHAP domain-containing protein [Rathayibacter caricis]|uniref:CHAP domain-containing protein n=1 Tax=Rathayibacter caricis TaxID=110936 RepID=UPI001FB56D48|nr:CHAP domain-containing protein [Rathayibacter caricis]MCJ1695848.1 CHAP domain-containing protein [Rathayibacter caricis]